jgi:putative membrane-bound dehydrogenase-like protein
MRRIKATYYYLFCLFILLTACQPSPFGESVSYPKENITLDDALASELAQKIKSETAVTVDDAFEIDLWASDSLVQDPIAISIDPQGRIFYTRASRQTNSEFDIRGHRNWMTASISFETVEDRRAFLRSTFTTDTTESQRFLEDLNEDGVRDWRDLAVEKEQVWFVEDASGDGTADHAQLYLKDFNEEVTDVANGLEYHDGQVFIGAAPDLWRTADIDGDGIADRKTSISHGFAVHIGFSGHGMSGVKVGPQGRIWWGIGDIGANVTDQTGKQWAYPNQGVVVRAEPDGSNFEVYAAGVRNTHEFVFDDYGNLITEDNDGDHRGERERLVYLINGSDSGWRTNWQFGKYTDPKSNSYKVWMEERLHVPHWEGQAAYILAPIQNYVNGPTGMVYNPGTALGPEWYKHFFIAEFRGSPANSPIHAFTLEPAGASFKLSSTKEVVNGLLPTGLDFGPDGALYFGDWIDGWGTKKEGRIWKLDVPGGKDQAIRQETKTLIQANFKAKTAPELQILLGHQDQRVRQKAQFDLAKRSKKGLDAFLETMHNSNPQLARIHAMWGLHQMARKQPDLAKYYLSYLEDQDPEIIAQAAKMLGDLRFEGATQKLMPLLQHPSLRIQMLSTEALGRIGASSAFAGIVEQVRQNNDQDLWLRHAGMVALGRIGSTEPLVALHKDPSLAVRTAAVVALRRMKDPGVAIFLNDPDEYIVTEAARAINDDTNITEALPALALVLKEARWSKEPLIRRAINANVEVGEEDNWKLLLRYAQNPKAAADMRAEALAALSNWSSPAVFDRVDGRYRGETSRDDSAMRAVATTVFVEAVQAKEPAVQLAAIKAAAKLNLQQVNSTLFDLVTNSKQAEIKAAALSSLSVLKSDQLDKALELALADRDAMVRSKALELLPASNLPLEKAMPLFEVIMVSGTVQEQQATLSALKDYQNPSVAGVLSALMEKMVSGELNPAIQLDLLEAAQAQSDERLSSQLNAFEAARAEGDALVQYQEALLGGDVRSGRQIFYNNEAAQCVRCHAVFEVGGNAGPGLLGVGHRLSREELLKSMVAPSAVFAAGYGVVILELNDGSTASGIVMDETDETITLKVGKEDIQKVQQADVKSRENIPSSMPKMGDLLSKRQLRDVVAFLASLEAEET